MTLELGNTQAWPAEDAPVLEPGFGQVRALWAVLWQPPDGRSREVGFGSELRLAKMRLGLLVILLASVTAQWLNDPGRLDGLLVLNTAAALLCGVASLLVVRTPPIPRWLPFVSSIADVTFVTIMLVLVMLAGDPRAATNSLVLYPIYYLAIGATALRSDSRICLLTGTLAIVQYGGVVLASSWLAPLAADPGAYGRFSWAAQVDRLILLAMATLLSTVTVLRSRRLLHRSTRDGLTGLYNRGFFEVLLEREAVQARRRGESFAVALVDVDHFKRLNDTYGHLGGDLALRRLGRQLGSNFRESDVVARYGGEEFALLLPRTDIATAWGLLERLRRRVEETPLALSGRTGTCQITVSIGVALWPHDGALAQDVLAVADRRLYAAKHAGRNRVMSSNWRPLEELFQTGWPGAAPGAGAGRSTRNPAAVSRCSSVSL